jgi:hypothetical protein
MTSLAELLAELRLEREALQCVHRELRELIVGASPRSIARTRELADIERHEERLEEYRFLREELKSVWSQCDTILTFTLAAVGATIIAAFSGRGDPIYLLPLSAGLTVGPYLLLEVHARRVWRIVGYMRASLEPRLKGIRWQIRLNARSVVWEKQKNYLVDFEKIDGHRIVLDCANVWILLLIVASDRLRVSPLLNKLGKVDVDVMGLAVCLSAAVPAALLFLSVWRHLVLMRGGKVEREIYESWKMRNSEGSILAEVEPPLEFPNEFDRL